MGLYSALSKRVVRVHPRLGVPLTSFHAWLNRVGGGRLGNTFIVHGAPVLFLITVGRKTGKRREAPLVYARDGDTFVVAASNAGAKTSPAWFHNLLAAGEAEARVGKATMPVKPHVVVGSERDRLWERLMAVYDGYDDYDEWTRRQIPVVVLVPR